MLPAARVSYGSEISNQFPSSSQTDGTTRTIFPSEPISLYSTSGEQLSDANVSLNEIALLNVEGLKTSTTSSVSFIRDILEEHTLLLIMLTETWLRDHLDAELSIENYTLYRADRNRTKKRRGRNSGGVAVYLISTLAADILFEYSNGVIEAICLKIQALNLILCVVYRQPDDVVGGHRSTADQFGVFLQKLSEELSNLPAPTPNIVLGGDFNIPHAIWPSGTAAQGASPDQRKMLDQITELSSQHFLYQINMEATHRAGNTLDLLFTNCADHFISQEVTPTAPISSHSLIKYSTLFQTSPNYREHNLRADPFDQVNLFDEKVNWQSIGDALQNTDWTSALSNLSRTEMLDNLLTSCRALALEYAPKKIRRKAKYSRIPRHRKILMRKRTRIRKSYRNQSSSEKRAKIQTKLIQIEEKLQDSYRSQENHDENRAISNIKSNSKYFFSYARRKAKLYVPTGPLQNSEGILESDPAEMAKILSQQYVAAFSTPAPVDLDLSGIPAAQISDIEFTEEDFIEAIGEVPSNSAPGPDRFPAVFLKTCKHELAKPLCLLWRRSVETGEVPEILKLSCIIPIHKGGSRSIPKNYRPVALTSHLVKVFEKIVRRRLVAFIEENNQMNQNQHGFRAGYSCLSQLLQHHEKITQLLEDNLNIDVIYLDFSKAFDKLDLKLTLQKLYNMGTRGKLFDWIASFLTNRHQYVTVDGQTSARVPVVSGVPQGSVLGPLIFLILLRDLDDDVTFSNVSSFADDTRVFAGIRNVEDTKNLQADLDKIYEWARNNNASFNSDKFECLRYGVDKSIAQTTSYLTCDGSPIQCGEHVRDLGVQMSADATFTQHITDLVRAASQKCGWILRVFKTRDRTTLLTLWKSLVAPLLDYCCQLWSPCTPGLIQKLETVQHSFFKKIAGLHSLDYWELLAALKMPSLQRRRERYICMYVWKILEGLVPNFGLESTNSKRRGRSCVVPTVKRTAGQRMQTIRHNSMGVLGPRIFNCLPSKVRDISGCSIDTFKKALDKYLDIVPDEPRVPQMVKYCSKSSNSLLQY